MSVSHCLCLGSNYGILLCLWLLLVPCVADEVGMEGDERKTGTETREGLSEDTADPELCRPASQEDVCFWDEKNPLYMYKTKYKCSISESQVTGHMTATPTPLSRPPKPICDVNKGCNPPLQCLNLSTVNDSEMAGVINQGRVVEINASQLEYLLDSSKYTNTCMILMFFARWCQYSANFAPVYNSLGHSFPQLPILALDFGDQDP